MAPPRKKQRVAEETPSAASNKYIGFVSCPENMRLDTAEDQEKVKQAVGDLIDLGAEFINVTCERTGVDISDSLSDLKAFADTRFSNKARPAGAYSCTENSISFWSSSLGTSYNINDIDPEGNVPAKGFFFNTNAAKLQSSQPFGQHCQLCPEYACCKHT